MIISYSLPPHPLQRYETESNSITFGRNPLPGQQIDIDLVQDEFVSHLHTRITCENDEYWVEDLGSTNATWVNDREISGKTQLSPGDKVRVGWTIVEIEMEAALPILEEEPAADTPTIIVESDSETFTRGSKEPSLSVPDSESALDSPTIITAPDDASPPITDLGSAPNAPSIDKGPLEVASSVSMPGLKPESE